MQYLGISESDLETLGGIHTAREISQQPELWLKIYQQIGSEKEEISYFLKNHQDVDKVILTGAGTSAYIGEATVSAFFRNFHPCTQAISTTNLVSHPYDYLSRDQSVLLISFARSGNSPESKAAVQLADDLSRECHHLIITCNADGDLARYEPRYSKYVFNLPSESNDLSLAMTSSYSGMLLSALLISRINDLPALKNQVDLASQYAQTVLRNHTSKLKEIASLSFKRAVFLGSGPLLATATESDLKLQELTDGNIICKHESFLGFRHGPKAVVDTQTVVVFLLSNVEYVAQYENDLIAAMKKGKKALAQVAVSEHADPALSVDYNIVFNEGSENLEEDFLTLPGILPAQILGFFKSIGEGLSPDRPSESGAISRVVEGVKIYELS